MKMKQCKAFTLVELLVVIAIISVLASMLLPALGKAVDVAQVVTCQSQLRQIYMGHMDYAEEHDGWFLIVRWATSAAIKLDSTADPLPYYGGVKGIFRCPTSKFLGNLPQYDVGVYRSGDGYRFTSYRVVAARSNHAPGAGYFYGHWAPSGYLPSSASDDTSGPCPNSRFTSRKLSDPDGGPQNVYIHASSKQPLAFDGLMTTKESWPPYASNQDQRNNHYGLDGINVLFLDGHTKWGSLFEDPQRFRSYGSGGWMCW